MANRKQQRARAERLHTRTEINRRLWRASRVAQIMYINMLHEHAHALSDRYCAAVFSYLAEDMAELQSLINQQHHH
ncbi:derepression protein [Escherichia coli]